MTEAVEMSGLDGANPLAFLAALGTVVTLHSAGERRVRLRWRVGATWTPVVTGVSASDPAGFSEIVARGLVGREVPPDAEVERALAADRERVARKAVKDKMSEVRGRKLARAERRAADEAELVPLKLALERAREDWLRALRAAVPRAELALGDRIDCTPEEYRKHANVLLGDSAGHDAIGMLAAFGTDASLTRGEKIEATPFQFLTGGGHQWFLKTARDLLDNVSAERIRRTLFEAWTYSDEKLSMRWDPVEDRRYALSDADPSAAAARTVWMANLLGYRALTLFSAAPRRGRLRVVGWTTVLGEPAFTWPLWEFFASVDTVRSLLALRELGSHPLDHASLRARGIAAVLRARRIKVGTGANYKINFAPARAV